MIHFSTGKKHTHIYFIFLHISISSFLCCKTRNYPKDKNCCKTKNCLFFFLFWNGIRFIPFVCSNGIRNYTKQISQNKQKIELSICWLNLLSHLHWYLIKINSNFSINIQRGSISTYFFCVSLCKWFLCYHIFHFNSYALSFSLILSMPQRFLAIIISDTAYLCFYASYVYYFLHYGIENDDVDNDDKNNNSSNTHSID